MVQIITSFFLGFAVWLALSRYGSKGVLLRHLYAVSDPDPKPRRCDVRLVAVLLEEHPLQNSLPPKPLLPHGLAQEFAGMVRGLGGERLEEWLTKARSCEAPTLRRFAASLKKHLAAVEAGLTEEWSNGPVEWFVNKLKLVKLQGYGGANLDLLRARMLVA